MEINEPTVKYETFPTLNPIEFIEWESTQEDKHEYISGKIIAMAGASLRHNIIQANILGTIYPVLAGKKCSIFASDLRGSVKSKESFFYPDATIVCGDVELSEDYKDTIKNPSVVFEILSPTTENYDLGRKFFMYMQVESLNEIIMIDSSVVHVRVGRRQANNAWLFEEYSDLEDSFLIAAIDYKLRLNDLYNGIKW